MSGEWIKAFVFAVGAALYVGLYGWILWATFNASGSPPDLGSFGALALTLSAAIGAYLARILGVQYPGVTRPFSISPNQFITVVVLVVAGAYVVIGVLCGFVNYHQHDHPELVPDVVSAGWKILIGLVVATFVTVFSNQPPPVEAQTPPKAS
jgi:Mg2+/citrate symporter